MTLYKNKYRIESTRLKGWDYSNDGYYFVTICTKDRECFFGDVIDGQMHLSHIGEIMLEEWKKTEEIREDVTIDEWVIMPNHIHGIIVIENKTMHLNASNVETHCNASLHRNNLSFIIRGFKSASTKKIHLADCPHFAWQPRYYDHIIRDENSLDKIREYILNNPLKWDIDENNPLNYQNVKTPRRDISMKTHQRCVSTNKK